MKNSKTIKALSLTLVLVLCLSVFSPAALASAEAPAVSLIEGGMPLPAVETAEALPEEPVTDAAAQPEIPAEEPLDKDPGDEVIRRRYINPYYAHVIDPEDIPLPDAPVLDGASPSFSTVNALGAYIREQMVARAEEISFYFSGDFDDVFDVALDQVAMIHTGSPKEGDSLAYQFGGAGGSCRGNAYTLELVYYTTAAQEAATDARVADIMESLDLPRASDYDTVKAVHDYLCDTVTYNTTGDDTPWTTYGALVQQICVCQGYSLAMYRLLLECGIDCRIIAGVGNGGPHAWNIVELGDYYYSLDATWDDQNYGTIYNWFLRGKTAFYQDHTPQDGPCLNYAWSSSFWSDYPMSLTDFDPNNPNGGTGEGAGGSTDDTDGIVISKDTFPDTNFRTYVAKNLDINLDGKLSAAEREAVTALNVSGLGILDLTGVGLFTELEMLECLDNYITELDVSGFQHLWYLDVSGNWLESLTLGDQPELYALYCENNRLEEVDVSGCPELTYFWCYNNALTELDVSGCPWLQDLWCSENYLDAVDVSACAALAVLVENVTPYYDYDDGYVDYYYEFEDGSYYDLTTDIGVMIRTRPRRGDVNGDGYINTADAVLVLRHTVGMGTLTGDAALQADTNFDEGIDVRDAAQILRFENSLTTIIQ